MFTNTLFNHLTPLAYPSDLPLLLDQLDLVETDQKNMRNVRELRVNL